MFWCIFALSEYDIQFVFVYIEGQIGEGNPINDITSMHIHNKKYELSSPAIRKLYPKEVRLKIVDKFIKNGNKILVYIYYVFYNSLLYIYFFTYFPS